MGLPLQSALPTLHPSHMHAVHARVQARHTPPPAHAPTRTHLQVPALVEKVAQVVVAHADGLLDEVGLVALRGGRSFGGVWRESLKGRVVGRRGECCGAHARGTVAGAAARLCTRRPPRPTTHPQHSPSTPPQPQAHTPPSPAAPTPAAPAGWWRGGPWPPPTACRWAGGGGVRCGMPVFG